MSTPDFTLVDKAYKAGNRRLAHELLDLQYSDTATPATARSSLGSGGNGQRPPLAMIVATAAIALLVLSPFLLSSPSDSQPRSSQSGDVQDAR